MRTLKKYFFEEKILLNKKFYYFNPVSSATGKPHPEDTLKVEQYNKKLKGKTDLHGQPYKPSIFYYSLIKPV